MPHPEGFPVVYRVPVGVTNAPPPEGHSWLHGSSYDGEYLLGIDPSGVWSPSQTVDFGRRLARWGRAVLDAQELLP